MRKRQLYINVISLILIVIFANLLAGRYFFSLDLTESKIYSLSKATKDLIEGLNERITVKVIFSKDIPYPYSTNTRYALDLLNDYRRFSEGKISIDIIPPENVKALDEAAGLYGIPSVQVNAIENDQIRIKRVYMGLAFVHADRIETIPVVSDIGNLEYQISSVLKSLMTKERRVIAFLTGHGEKPLARLKEALRKNYEVKTLNIKDQDTQLDADLVIIAGPTERYSEEELLKIDQFILRGGKALFLLDRVQADPQYGFGRTLETGLEDLLEEYGVKIKPALVYDLSAGLINVSERRGGFLFTTVTAYPFFPRILDLDRDSIITKNIETVTLGYASPIELTEQAGIETTVLAKTSRRSGVLNPPFYVAVGRSFSEKDFQGPPTPVAVLLSGMFKSKFSGEKKDIIKEGKSRIIIVSDSDFATDEFIDSPGNGQFVLNAIDWLAEDDSLITIRSKNVESRPIRDVTPTLQRAIRYTTVLLPPVLVVFTGVILWRIRKSRRERP